MRKYPGRHRAVISAIRDARREKGISQRALSEKLGEVSNYIHMIEAGQRNVLAEEFIVIAEMLGIDPHELLSRVLRRRA
jgi:ribosome-binding protein aMBF1 (putative translation factor)